MTIEWIIGMVVLALAGLLALHLKHTSDCTAREQLRAASDAKINEQLAVITKSVTSIEREMGDRESGIRGQLHSHTKEIILLNAKVGLT